jgi:hypothetical protein
MEMEMLFSVKDAFRVLAAYIPEELAAPADLERISSMTRELPFALSHHLRLGFPLGPDQGIASFVMKIAAPEGREIVAGAHPVVSLPGEVLADPAWAFLRNFCLNWADTTGPLQQHVQGLWMEFDLACQPHDRLVRKLFFFLEESKPAQYGSNRAADSSWIVHTAIPLLTARFLSGEVASRVATCLEAARGRAQVLQIGVFQEPVLPGLVQIGLFPHSEEALLAYLDAIEWAAPVPDIAEIIAPLYQLGADVCLNVTVGEKVEQQIGLECHFNWAAPPERLQLYAALLDHLVERGLCTQGKRAALLSFPGYSIENILYDHVFFRGVFQVEVSYRAGHPTVAWTYLGCTHKPLVQLTRAV